jgi:hypothetical protein
MQKTATGSAARHLDAVPGLILRTRPLVINCIYTLLFPALACLMACRPEGGQASQNQAAVTETGNAIQVSDNRRLRESSDAGYSFDGKILVFDSIKDKSLLQSIYAPAEIITKDYSKKGLKKALLEFMERKFAEAAKAAGGEYSYDMEVHSINDNLMTILYKHQGYWGGAHGGVSVIYKVFDLKNNKPVLLHDIIKNPKDALWDKLLKARLFAQYREDGIEIGEDSLTVAAIPPNENFYFDKWGITFLYNQYDIMPYSMGAPAIYIPFDKKIETLLMPNYAKLAAQNPVICEFPDKTLLLGSIGQDKNFSLTLALCDEVFKCGYVLYSGQTERMAIRLDHEEEGANGRQLFYSEIYRGKVNGQFVLALEGERIIGAHFIRKSDDSDTKIDFEITDGEQT